MRAIDRMALACAFGLSFAVAPPAATQGGGASSPDTIAERTAQSDLPLDPVRANMALPYAALSLTVDPTSRSISGEIRYRVTARSALDSLAFDLAPRYAISKVEVDGVAADWTNPDGLLSIVLPSTLAEGEEAQVTIAWSGNPHVAVMPPWDGGITWSSALDANGAPHPWIATAIQGEGCDMFWPCIDHSSSRIALMDMAVMVPEPLVVAGNGALQNVEHDNGWATWRWRAKYPNNYGVTLQIGPYELTEQDYTSQYGNIIPLKFWHLPGHGAEAGRLLGELGQSIAFFEEQIGPYPFYDEKAGIAETPHLGMEHQTINAYGNEFKRDPLGYDWLLAHEFAHEWFANQLTHSSINHMWLHEGLGTYMQPLFLEWSRGRMLADSELWRSRRQIRSRVPLVPPEDESPDYLDQEAAWGGDIYYKGAWVAHSLRYLIGDDAFFESLTRLVYGRPDPMPGNFAPVSRSTADFEAIAEEISGKDLGWFFDAYLYRSELPKLVVQRDGRWLDLAWESGSDLPFAMPVEVRVGDRVEKVPMDSGKGRIDMGSVGAHYLLDPENHILRDDPAITAWQAERDAERGAQAAAE